MIEQTQTRVMECLKCGGTEIGEGKQSGYSVMVPVNRFSLRGSAITYRICIRCGYIIEGYVKNPDKFKK